MNGFASMTFPVSASRMRMPSLAIWNSRRYRTSECSKAASARLRIVTSSMARSTKSGSFVSGGNLRALSSMFLRPSVGKSCSTSKSSTGWLLLRTWVSSVRSWGMFH